MSKFSFLTRKVRTTRISGYVKFFLSSFEIGHTRISVSEMYYISRIQPYFIFLRYLCSLCCIKLWKVSCVQRYSVWHFLAFTYPYKKWSGKMFSNLIIFFYTVEIYYSLYCTYSRVVRFLISIMILLMCSIHW